jgi:hypothetical protein
MDTSALDPGRRSGNDLDDVLRHGTGISGDDESLVGRRAEGPCAQGPDRPAGPRPPLLR